MLKNLKYLQIADPQVLIIPILECHEPLIDLKNQKILKFGPPPECKETEGCYTKLRETVYEKLCLAQENLPNSWRFKIYEGYRSLAVQQLLFNWISQKIDQESPGLDPIERFRQITQLVSPLKNLAGEVNIPVHNTGAAVDVELIDAKGNLVDMGMAVKDWIQVDPKLCLTDCDLISQEAKENRRILINTMEAQDFVNYPWEWWHFSYGDRYWAALKNKPFARYGSANLL